MRLLPMDQLYGHLSIIEQAEGGADTFASTQIADAVIAPDVIIDEDLFSETGGLEIENVLCWDVGEWQSHITGAMGELAGGENVGQRIATGIVLDNRVTPVAPTSDTGAQQTTPGETNFNTDSRYVERFVHMHFLNEENAAGEINNPTAKPLVVRQPPRTRVREGKSQRYFDVGSVLTAAHYHHWVDSTSTGETLNSNLGAKVRRIEVDFVELMFDRQTLLGILAAVNQVF